MKIIFFSAIEHHFKFTKSMNFSVSSVLGEAANHKYIPFRFETFDCKNKILSFCISGNARHQFFIKLICRSILNKKERKHYLGNEHCLQHLYLLLEYIILHGYDSYFRTFYIYFSKVSSPSLVTQYF